MKMVLRLLEYTPFADFGIQKSYVVILIHKHIFNCYKLLFILIYAFIKHFRVVTILTILIRECPFLQLICGELQAKYNRRREPFLNKKISLGFCMRKTVENPSIL